MSEIVARVAKAILEDAPVRCRMTHDEAVTSAVAAIEAMRVLDSTERLAGYAYVSSVGGVASTTEIVRLWNCIIDRILTA